MTTVTSQELKQKYGQCRITAHREPVFITNHGKDDLVLMSTQEYQRLQQLEQRAFHASEMPEDVLNALNHDSISKEAQSYNHEANQ